MTGNTDDRDALVATLHALEEQGAAMLAKSDEAQHQFMWAQANRLGLLWVHAGGGIGIGALMLMFGSAASFEATIGLWVRSAFGLTGILGGVLLAVGLTRRPLRSIRLEAAGLSILALWDVAIMASFVTVFSENPPQMCWPWEPIPDSQSRAYPVAVYGTLLALLLLHVYTLRGLTRMRRSPRA